MNKRIIGQGYVLHLTDTYADGTRDGTYHIWLNTQGDDFDGLCLGTGTTEQAAIQASANVLETLLEALNGPPMSWTEEK